MKFILRDLLWLIVVVSLAAGWYAHSRQAAQTIQSQSKIIEQQETEIASRDSDLDRAFQLERRLRMDLRHRGAPAELLPTPGR
jgi:uncharacterized protein HemX